MGNSTIGKGVHAPPGGRLIDGGGWVDIGEVRVGGNRRVPSVHRGLDVPREMLSQLAIPPTD